jgi:hypothetical protein
MRMIREEDLTEQSIPDIPDTNGQAAELKRTPAVVEGLSLSLSLTIAGLPGAAGRESLQS